MLMSSQRRLHPSENSSVRYFLSVILCLLFPSLLLMSCRSTAVAPTGDSNAGIIPMNLIYYGAFTPAVNSLIIAARPQYVIVNTPHGPWGQISVDNALQDIAAYQESGIKVIGYITAGYEGTYTDGDIPAQWYSLAANEQSITYMAKLDGVNGVFIDECSAFPDQTGKDYLTALTSLAHSLGLLTWGNVGEADFDSWYFTAGGFDMMQSIEDWTGQDLTQVQKDWSSRISVTGSSGDMTALNAFNLTENAWQKGIAYCYISDTGYDLMPSWFETYVQLIRGYNVKN
jgi:hypothetical protein